MHFYPQDQVRKTKEMDYSFKGSGALGPHQHASVLDSVQGVAAVLPCLPVDTVIPPETA